MNQSSDTASTDLRQVIADLERELTGVRAERDEARQQQKASAEILRLINASVADSRPVFDKILDSCKFLFGGDELDILLVDDEGQLRVAAYVGNAHDAVMATFPAPIDGTPAGRAIRERRVAHFPDVLNNPDTPRVLRRMGETVGYHSIAFAPMIWRDQGVGAVGVARASGAFSERELELLQSFADQAVVAIGNARLFNETRDALERQTAISDILSVINSSPDNLAAVFEAMLDHALRLCGAESGHFRTYDGQGFELVAVRGAADHIDQMRQRGTLVPGPHHPVRRFLWGEDVIHMPDATQSDEYTADPGFHGVVDVGGARAMLAVALRRDGTLLGFLNVYRPKAGAFSSHQIGLLQNFAAQAVIAIENARLFTELRESLEQQTATSELLQVINSSPGEIGHVFEAMLEKAMRLCGAMVGDLRVYDGEDFRQVAALGVPEAYVEHFRTRSVSYGPGTGPARIMAGEPVVHIPDLVDTDAYRRRDPDRVALVELAGARASLIVPLIKDEKVAGFIMILRQETGAFTDKQIALLQNFAAQAVIAMENARLLGELREALEQQTATAEVLQVINSFPGDLRPVFDVMLEKALRLCEATCGTFQSFDGERMHRVAGRGHAAFDAWMRENPSQPPDPGTTMARLVAGEDVAQVVGLDSTDAYRSGVPIRQALVEVGGFQSLLGIALRKDDVLLGAIHVYRQEARPFSEKQIALLQNFAAQAVIAMENARLVTEQREALERQTATAEVLRIINASPGVLEPVFDAILAKAHDLCGATLGSLQIMDGVQFRAVATRGMDDAFAGFLRNGYRPSVTSTLSHERSTQFADVTELADQNPDDPVWRATTELGRIRTLLAVPLVKDGKFLGRIVAARQEVRPFTEKQIALLESFAAQAVIAMENARLLSELRDQTDALARRNSEFGERIEQQAATIDVLKVMSSSPDNPQPVFDLIARRSRDLCNGLGTSVFEFDGNMVYHRAITEGEAPAEELAVYDALFPMAPDRGSLTCRAILDRRIVHVRDLQAEDVLPAVRNLGYLSQLTIPFLRDGKAIGAITLTRREAGGFTDSQVALLQTFAEQAVIAISSAENHRALRQRTEALARSVAELQALEEVLRAVNSSLDVETVLSTIISRAVELSGADEGTIYEFDESEKVFVPKSAVGMSAERIEALRARQVRLGDTHLGRAAISRAPVHVEDIQRDPSLAAGDATNLLEGIHAVLAVPLLRNNTVVGGLVIRRREIGGFAPTIQTLLQTFAGQAVLAIENARLFRALEEKNRQLAVASQHKSQFLANMSHELRTPLNAILGYTEMMADGLYGGLGEKATSVLERVQSNGKHLLGLINDVLDLSKIEAGELKLSLDEYRLADVVAAVISATESLAKTKGLDLHAVVPPRLPVGRGDARRLTQVLLNLVGNALKFTDKGGVEIRASSENGKFHLAVIDSGPGIAPADQARIFEEFQQIDTSSTRKKGGTGLGLSISRKFVEMHGGAITVESELGAGSTFHVVWPITPELAGDRA